MDKTIKILLVLAVVIIIIVIIIVYVNKSSKNKNEELLVEIERENEKIKILAEEKIQQKREEIELEAKNEADKILNEAEADSAKILAAAETKAATEAKDAEEAAKLKSDADAEAIIIEEEAADATERIRIEAEKKIMEAERKAKEDAQIEAIRTANRLRAEFLEEQKLIVKNKLLEVPNYRRHLYKKCHVLTRGDSMSGSTNHSAQYCADKCIQKKDCVAFEYKPLEPKYQCYYKDHTKCYENKVRDDENTGTYFIIQREETNLPDNFTEMKNKWCNTSPIAGMLTSKKLPFDECVQRCANDPRCTLMKYKDGRCTNNNLCTSDIYNNVGSIYRVQR